MKPLIIITGPTAVGKTDFALELGARMPIEIINGDMGQLYTPLTIGTAKPAWRTEAIPHHLFDHVSDPVNYAVTQYRSAVGELIAQIQARGNTPVIVGGSLFYLRSLFFPPVSPEKGPSTRPSMNSGLAQDDREGECSWEALNAIDPERAAHINPNDQYRIERALDLWYQTGVAPSLFKPVYNPIHLPCRMIYFSRERSALYERINSRTELMLATGWLEEVHGLSAEWRAFLRTKKIIGYAEIDAGADRAALTADIQQKTRHYAKKQETAWRTLKKALKPHPEIEIDEFDLTLSATHLYIDGLLQAFKEV